MLCMKIIAVYLENTRRNSNERISAVHTVHHVRNYVFIKPAFNAPLLVNQFTLFN